MFKAPFSFEGRIRRMEYGLSLIIYVISFFVAIFLGDFLMGWGGTFLLFLALVPVFWFLIAQGVKRCHDRGMDGQRFVNPLNGVWLIFADGEPHDNQYGPDPKGRGGRRSFPSDSNQDILDSNV